MFISQARRNRRRAAVTVETAFILIPMTMMLFGIFEYGRLLVDWNLLDNAAREGCRFALANNTDSSISTEVQSIVSNYMAGKDSAFTNFTVTVNGTHNGASTTVNNLMPGDLITVTVSGNYQFMNVIPLIRMPTSFSVTSSVTMICEGGT